MIISAGCKILHVRMNMQFDIRQLTDVSGCNLQQHLPCNRGPSRSASRAPHSAPRRSPRHLVLPASAGGRRGSLTRATGGARAGVRPVASAAAWPDRAENSVKWEGKPMTLGSTGEPE